MKTILIMRHAKSDWHSASRSDHDRPLNKRGRSASAIMGRFLSERRQVPQVVLVSSAVRARSTVDLAVAAGGWTCPIVVVPELYGASPDDILTLVRGQDDSIDSLMLAGHEPTSSSLAQALVRAESFSFPTAAVARIDFPVDFWSQIEFGGGQSKWFVSPKTVLSAQASKWSPI